MTRPTKNTSSDVTSPRLSDFPEPLVQVRDYKQKASHRASRKLPARHPAVDAEQHDAWYWKKLSDESIARIIASQK